MMFEIVSIAHAAGGVIDNAPKLATVLARTANFLLLVFGVLAIIAMVIAGLIYFTANGDEKRIAIAKKAVAYAVTGALIAVGSLVIVRQIALFFE